MAKTKGTDTPPKPYKAPRRRNFHDKPRPAERDLIAALVLEQPSGLDDRQIRNLSLAMRRTKDDIKAIIEDARDTFAGHAGRYVEIHKQSAEKALKKGDAKSLEVAARSAQWAIERMSADGVRIVDKPEVQAGGAKILVGIRVGGIDEPVTTVTVPPAAQDDAAPV